MRLRGLAALTAAFLLVVIGAAPAVARWLRSSDPSDTVNATLRVDASPTVTTGGWQVAWDVRITCPRGEPITGRALVAERDPASIPALAGEDQGITAIRDLSGDDRCTGHRQTLHLVLHVLDTQVVDGSTGETHTYHEPIHPTPANRTSAAIQLSSPRSPDEGGFFVQYCAAPNCASESGPRVTLR
jgi:hypothetical protein